MASNEWGTAIVVVRTFKVVPRLSTIPYMELQ